MGTVLANTDGPAAQDYGGIGFAVGIAMAWFISGIPVYYRRRKSVWLAELGGTVKTRRRGRQTGGTASRSSLAARCPRRATPSSCSSRIRCSRTGSSCSPSPATAGVRRTGCDRVAIVGLRFGIVLLFFWLLGGWFARAGIPGAGGDLRLISAVLVSAESYGRTWVTTD
jgi:hypothetical protein